ncbi:MAG: NADH-quinone oxidoreductase subunit N [Fibrobacteraceae bacterium]|nr:NADH-quinone oxidoreductase subunit N [Fibrobacteraceae bacterium]
MSANFVNLLPIAIVALGAMISIAVEPFLVNKNKHRVLPWVAASFLFIAAGSFLFVSQDTLYGLFAMDPIRRLLGLVVIFCAFLGIGGLQATLAREEYPAGEPYGLLLLATSGALIMTQAIDFLSLFIGMELAAYPIYGLVGLRRKDRNANEGTFKYFVTGAVFSVIFLYGMALIYGATGSTHFSAAIVPGRASLYYAGLLLALFALLFKAGAAPMHFWVADVYTGAPVVVTGFMAAVVKVGALAALGSLWLGSLATEGGLPAVWNLAEEETVAGAPHKLALIVIAVAMLSIVIGAFSGLLQKSVRRIFAFSAVMNAGFIALGLILPDYVHGGKVQLGPMYFYLITYALASAAALTGISSMSGKGDEKETLDALRGRARRKPLEGIATVVALASLAGLPPLSGFIAKFTLFAGVVSAGWIAVAAIGFALSVVAVFYYLRIAIALFAPASVEEANKTCALPSSSVFLLRLGTVAAALMLLGLSVAPAAGLVTMIAE